MALDPSIALGVKPVEIANPLNQFAQVAQLQHYQQQNALATRAMEQEDALNRAYAASINKDTGEIDANMLRQNMATGGIASKLPAAEKSIMEGRELKAKVTKGEFENKKAQYESSINDILRFDNHDQILGALDAKVKSGELKLEQAQQLASTVPQDPRMIPAWQIKTARGLLSAKDQLEQHFQEQDYGGGKRILGMNKYGGGPAQVVQGSEVKKTATPGELLVDARAKENLKIAQENQRREGDPAFQQQLAEAKALGQNMAKDKVLRATQLPKVLDTAEMTLREIDDLIGKRNTEGKLLPGEKPHPGFETAVGATYLPGARFVPGAPAADFQKRFDQIKGGAFLQAFETLKGGGSITNIEGDKGTAALNRMDLAQSEKEFVQAAREFQGIVRKGVERASKLAGTPVPNESPAAPVTPVPSVVRVPAAAPAAAPAANVIDFGSLK
jgi:hypothetical protein